VGRLQLHSALVDASNLVVLFLLHGEELLEHRDDLVKFLRQGANGRREVPEMFAHRLHDIEEFVVLRGQFSGDRVVGQRQQRRRVKASRRMNTSLVMMAKSSCRPISAFLTNRYDIFVEGLYKPLERWGEMHLSSALLTFALPSRCAPQAA
jgi:hypothetical protein